jgi:FKBP12-rapamycin complex-associated protein
LNLRAARLDNLRKIEALWRLRFEALPERPNVLHEVLCIRSIALPPSSLISEWERLLECAISHNRFELADSTIRFLKRNDAVSPDVESLEIRLRWQRGAREEAVQALSRLPSTFSRELTLGDWLSQLGRFQDARPHLRTASQLSEDVRVWRLWSFVSLKVFETAQTESFLVDALEGALSGLALSVNDSLSFCVRILSILFRHGSVKTVFGRFRARLRDIPAQVWIGVMPQIIARANSKDPDLRELIQSLILAIGREHPQVVLYSLMVPIKGETNERQRIASRIFEELQLQFPTIAAQMMTVSDELIRSAVSWWELWHFALDEASRALMARQAYDEMVAILEEAHHATARPPETLLESVFMRQFGTQISTAHAFLGRYATTKREEYLHSAWQIYIVLFRAITPLLPEISEVSLADAAPRLLEVRDLEIVVPGTYVYNEDMVYLQAVREKLVVMTSKQRPRRMEVTGSNGASYTFLLKAHEDTRLDERVMQFFELINSLLSQSALPLADQMSITTYRVIPLTGSVGLIGWVPHCNPLCEVITKARAKKMRDVEIEAVTLQKLAPNYDSLPLSDKMQVFNKALASAPGNELKRLLLARANDSNDWIARRTAYSASLAVTSIAGYILGLGDRHLSNIMIKQRTAKLVHIDFGDCFEVAMHRDQFPEVVPFRLTRMLRNALEVSGIEGTFRSCCENSMRLIHENGEQIEGLLEVFIDDPLLQWITVADKVGGEGDMESVKIVKRIASKLKGCDFNDGKVYGPESQVDRLIEEAIRLENLCVMFRGWIPWW